MTDKCYDRIIIGAGLYGLYAADSCGRRGDKVLVLEKDDDYSNAEGILEDMNSDEIENLFDNTMDIEYRYEEGNTVADNMTKEQVRNSYSSEELIIADDCQDVF